jgi:hypothetical protein
MARYKIPSRATGGTGGGGRPLANTPRNVQQPRRLGTTGTLRPAAPTLANSGQRQPAVPRQRRRMRPGKIFFYPMRINLLLSSTVYRIQCCRSHVLSF